MPRLSIDRKSEGPSLVVRDASARDSSRRRPRGRAAGFCLLGALVGVGGFISISQQHQIDQGAQEKSAEVAIAAKAAIEHSQLEAREGLVPWGGAGPRPPSNERERRWAEIPVYHPEEDLVFFSHIHKTSGTSLSMLLMNIFPKDSIVPTSQPSKGLTVAQLKGHDKAWWKPFKVMYGHNRPNVTDDIILPGTKKPRLLLTVRNPLLHKASIFFESVCRFGLHIKDGKIDVEEATRARMESNVMNSEMFSFCRDPSLWLDSPQFLKVYRNFQANWLSYGSVSRPDCIKPQNELNIWNRENTADGCETLLVEGKDEQVWQDFFDRNAEAAIRRLEGALWVGVTERSEEAVCLLLLTLNKPYAPIGSYRFKEPRPISVWSDEAIAKAAEKDRSEWTVFDAANDILDLRLWTAKERLKNAGEDERDRLGSCFDVLTGDLSVPKYR